jgi:putative flippase GtrA
MRAVWRHRSRGVALSPDSQVALISGFIGLVTLPGMTLTDRAPVPIAEPALAPPVTPVLDLVVPVLDEAHVLEASIRRLHEHLTRSMPYPWRITIADNGSTDGTREIAERLAEQLSRLRVVALDRRGRGLALREAWSSSDAAVLAYTDVDLSTGLDALLPLVAPLVSGHSDVAIGSRLAPGASVARGPRREVCSRAYNLILRTAFATRFSDAQCGFKAIRADAAAELLPQVVDDGWFFDTELLLLADHNGLRIHEVAVDWVDDPDSRVDVVSTATDDLRGVVRMLRRFARGEGRIAEGGYHRDGVADDMGRQLVVFGLIGALSTAVSLVVFLLTRSVLGAVLADVLAVSVTVVANTWAHRRHTFGRQGTGRVQDVVTAAAVWAGGVALSTAALVLVVAAGGGLGLELLALAATWSLTSFVRFALLRGAPR